MSAVQAMRDPRVDPRPDDVLAVGRDVREVLCHRDGRVAYGFPGRSAVRTLPLAAWQRWARTADVREATA